MKKIYQRTMTICAASLFEEILVMVIVFSFPETNFQRTMTICARSFLEGILVMVIVFFRRRI